MTDDDRPRSCSKHDWHPPVPRLVENKAGEWVEHPTELMRWCMDCPATESVEGQPR